MKNILPRKTEHYDYSELNSPARRADHKMGFWRKLANPGRDGMLRLGGYAIVSVLVLNVALFIYSFVGPQALGASTLSWFSAVFYGTCSRAQNTKLGMDLVINVLSTVLLSTSTVAMQILSAPTRKEIDAAHSQGRWLDVGVLSSRNLRSAPRIRTILWVLLMLSSIPLHLVYNSVIFLSSGANDVLAVLVAGDVATTQLKPWTDAEKKMMARTATLVGQPSPKICDIQDFHLENTTFRGEDPRPDDILAALNGLETSLKQQSLVRMDPASCKTTFATDALQGYSAVLLVTNLTTTSSNDSSFIDFQWTSAVAAPNWTAHDLTSSSLNSTTYLRGTNLNLSRSSTESFAGVPFVVDHCLAQPAPTLCSVQVAQQLLIAVIVANIVKLAVIVYMVMYMRFEPLVTIGDAVVNFMNDPDLCTAGAGPVSSAEVRRWGQKFRSKEQNSLPRHERAWYNRGVFRSRAGSKKENLQSLHDRVWSNKRLFWFKAGSLGRWLTAMLLVFFFIAAGAFWVIDGTDSSQGGFGTASPSNTFLYNNPTWIAVLAANAPQVAISAAYIIYNSLVTCMLASAEFMDFASQAKPMRVSSDERGQQRSSYFLQIPYKYALPVMALMALLHWAVGQSLFLVHIDTYSVSQQVSRAAMVSTVGYSHNGAVVALALSLLIFIFPFVIGFRRFPGGVPLVGHCSLAISAACHPASYEPVDASERPLAYGVLGETGSQGRRRVGFSSLQVDSLQDGAMYEQDRCAKALRHPGVQLDCCSNVGQELGTWEDVQITGTSKT